MAMATLLAVHIFAIKYWSSAEKYTDYRLCVWLRRKIHLIQLQKIVINEGTRLSKCGPNSYQKFDNI
jgi:hypothetical protein